MSRAFQQELYRRYNRNPSVSLELFMDTIGKHLVNNYAPSSSSSSPIVELQIPGQEGRLEIKARDGKQVHEAVTETILGTPVSSKYKVSIHDTMTGKDVTQEYHKNAVQAMRMYPSINARINGQKIKEIRRKVEVPARFSTDRMPHLEKYCKSMIVAARARAAGMSASEIETKPENVMKFRPHELERETGFRATDELGVEIGARVTQHILQEQQDDLLKPIAHVDSQLLEDVMYQVRKHDAMQDLIPIDMQFRNEAERSAVDAHYDDLLMKHHDLVPIGQSVAVARGQRELPKLVPIGSNVSTRTLPKLVPIGTQQQPARIACHGKPYSKKKKGDEDEEVNAHLQIGCHNSETCEQRTVCRGGVCTSVTRCHRHTKKSPSTTTPKKEKESSMEEIDAPIRRPSRGGQLPSIDGLFSDLNRSPKKDPLLASTQKRVTLLNKEGSPRGNSLVADSYRTRKAGRFIEFRTRNGDDHVIEDHRIHRVNGRVQTQYVKSVTADDQSLYIHFE